MTHPQARRPDPLAGVRPKPIAMRALPPGSPAVPDRLLTGDRRNAASRAALVQRIYREFREMPGLCLTLQQAVRLFSVREDICLRVFGTLAAEGLVGRNAEGRYVRMHGVL